MQNLKTPTAYAKEVGVPRSTINSRIASGTIKATEIGGRKFIDLDQYPPDQFQKSAGGRPKKQRG